VDLCYKISKLNDHIGSPEPLLSDLEQKMFFSYWKYMIGKEILNVLCKGEDEKVGER
jgi:hypothetical protein